MVHTTFRPSDDPPGLSWGAVGALAFFLGIPLFLGWTGWREILLERQSAYKTRQIELVDLCLSRIAYDGDTGKYFERLLRTLEERVFASPDPERTFTRFRQHLARRFPGVFAFTFLDAGGNPIRRCSDGSPPKVLLRRFFTAYRDFLEGRDVSLDPQASFVRTFFGPFVPGGEEIHQRLLFATGNAARRFVYLTRPRPSGGFTVHLTNTPNWETLALQDRIRRQRGRGSRLRLALIGREGPTRRTFVDLGIPESQGQKIWGKASRNLDGICWEGGGLWGKRVVKPSASLLGRLETPDQDSIPRLIVLSRAGFLGIWLMLLVGSLAGISHYGFPSIPVRMRLALAFLYSAGAPLTIMGISSASYLAEMRVVLETSLFNTVERAIMTFDNSFPSSFDHLSRSLRQEFLSRQVVPGQSLRAFARDFVKAHETFHWDQLKIFDQGGKNLLEGVQISPEAGPRISMKMFEGAAADIIQRLNKGRVAVASEATKQLDGLRQEAGKEEIEWLFSMLSRELWKVAPYDIGVRKFLITMFPVYDAAGIARTLVMMAWERDRLILQYIRGQLTPFARGLPDTEVYAVHASEASRSYPPQFRHLPVIAGFLPTVRATEVGFRRSVTRNGRTLLVTGRKCQDMTDFSLVAVSQDRLIRHEIRQIALRLGIFGGFIALLSGVTASLLATRLLQPIRELGRGLEAIGRGDFQFRLTLSANDELGDLGQAVNGLIPELGELHTAKTIQDNLFPATELCFSGWELFGRCQAMCHVGGDYFDYFPIDRRRTAFLLGDVSGHGVSAGLVMAMAKALVAHPLTGNDPGQVLAKLQTVLLSTLERKKMMTCLFGVFDAATGVLRLANAGQSYPMVVGETSVRELKIQGNPLGTRTKRPYLAEEFPFAPGEFALFYSDGLVEATETNGQVIGFSGLIAALPQLRRGSARETEAAIRAWHQRKTGGAPQEDDITILVLQQTSGGGEG